MLDRWLLNPIRYVSPHPSLALRPSDETTAQLSGEEGADFLSRSTQTLSFLMEAQQSVWRHPAYMLRTTDLRSPPGTWEDSSLIPALSRLSLGVRPGISGLFILLGLTKLQGWRWHNLSWPLLHCWAVFMGKTLFLFIKLSISFCSLWLLPFTLLLFAALRSSFSVTSSLILSGRHSKNGTAP